MSDERFAVRIEVFEGPAGAFRVRTARLDLLRVQGTHPLDVWGAPASPPHDEEIRVAWPRAEEAVRSIRAADVDAALADSVRWVRDRAAAEQRSRG